MRAVTIVMTTFNGAQFVREQLESLSTQEHLPYEIIISDDGSTDRTLDYVEDFRKSAPFPILVRQNDKRLGYAENFLIATKLAKGEYIAFCDQDDIWYPNKLKIAVERLSNTGADLFVHSARLIDESGRHIGSFSQRIRCAKLYRPLQLGPWSVFYGFSMVFSRRLFTLVDPAERGRHTFEFEGLLSHDLWVYFLASSVGHVIVESTPLASYRQHSNNQTPHVPFDWLKAWRISLGPAAHPKLLRSEIAAHRCKLMKKLSISANEADLCRVAAHASEYWCKISKYERNRLQVYLHASALRRILECCGLIRRGGYRSFRSGGLGKRLLLKDVLVGVIRAHRWKAYRPSIIPSFRNEHRL